MVIRKLRKEEHNLSRSLYETVFFEDEKSFVDYYYQYRARENVIYGAEDGAGLHAMVHLNPCQISWNGETKEISYLVAVATEEKYRHQGLMRLLLELALKEEYQRKAPFIFLMPASESIYTPFGFRRAWKWQWEDRVMNEPLVLRAAEAAETVWIPAAECGEKQLWELSRRVNLSLAQRFTMFVRRSPAYYRRLAREQEASGGRLDILFENGVPVCSRCSAREEFPPMMVRILNLEAFLSRVRTGKERVCIWRIRDELLPENNGLFEVTLTEEGGRLCRLPEAASEAEGPEAGGRWRKPVALDISQVPEALGQDNPFLHTMISEVV